MLASASFCRSLATSDNTNCFPYGSAVLPKDLSPPDVPLDEWRCPSSMAYGFQGFSYPLEVSDCSDPSNSFEAMSADFAQMKRDFGASIVRMYYPTCLQSSVFENALKAGVANDMAVIFQVWTDFGNSVRIFIIIVINITYFNFLLVVQKKKKLLVDFKSLYFRSI